MSKSKEINIEGSQINIINFNNEDYISLTDMAKSQHQEIVIFKWMSLKSTIDYLGEWELLYNPTFNYTEFGIIKNEADLLNMALFGKTAQQWRSENPEKEGNIRDMATIEQLVVLSNLESINAVLIHNKLTASERIYQLNQIAITQMKSLLGNTQIKKIK